MAGAVMYQQLNHQAAAMAYQDIYRLLSWMGMVACAFILSKTSLVMSSWRRSRALAIFLAMTVMPGQKFHPAAKCVTAAHDVASWGLPEAGLRPICGCKSPAKWPKCY
jgi:hypothetical protein